MNKIGNNRTKLDEAREDTESSLLATTSLGECGVMAEELKRSGLVCGVSTLPRYDSSIGVDEMKRIMLTAAPVLPVLRQVPDLHCRGACRAARGRRPYGQ